MPLPSKKELKFASLMSVITTFFVTFVLVSVNLGFTDAFFFVWMRSWLLAFVLVALAILFVAPRVRAFLEREA